MYSRLIAISQEALESAYYETAYHALCAAMHYAYIQSDEHRLEMVGQAAKAQLDWIDANAKEHKMSTQSVMKRSGVNLYNSLLTQVHADLVILRQKKR
ncbi:hypothetical protein [Brasilonema bromeliae]|nr:hypothetical protein [Brasilonema bromeliae]